MALASAYSFAGTATASPVAFVPPPASIHFVGHRARAIGLGDAQGQQQLELELELESARCSRVLRTMGMMSEVEAGKSEYSDVSAQLLERARLAREEVGTRPRDVGVHW